MWPPYLRHSSLAWSWVKADAGAGAKTISPNNVASILNLVIEALPSNSGAKPPVAQTETLVLGTSVFDGQTGSNNTSATKILQWRLRILDFDPGLRRSRAIEHRYGDRRSGAAKSGRRAGVWLIRPIENVNYRFRVAKLAKQLIWLGRKRALPVKKIRICWRHIKERCRMK